MSLAQRFERRLESVVGSAFARVFKGQVEPVEIGNALQREAADKRAVMGNGKVFAPNRYRVTLGSSDYERLAPWEGQLTNSLAELVQEHLDQNGWTTVGDIEVYLHRDDSLHTGVFGVASRMESEAPPRQRPFDSLSLPAIEGAGGHYLQPYDPNASGGSGGYAASEPHPAGGYGQPDGPARPGYDQPGYGQSGYDQPGYDQSGGYRPDGPEQGQGGYDQGGYAVPAAESGAEGAGPAGFGAAAFGAAGFGAAGYGAAGYGAAPSVNQPYGADQHGAQGYSNQPYGEQPGYSNQPPNQPPNQPYGQDQYGGAGGYAAPPPAPPQPRLLAWLVVDGTDQHLQLRQGSNLVGRGHDCDMQLLDQGVSRRHVDVQFDGQYAVAYDLGSTNGTSVNGHFVGSHQLQHGDVLRVGHSRLVYQQEAR